MTSFGRVVSLVPGFHTNRKIIVIESDDWGCWRTRDRRSLEILSKKSPHILSDPYTQLDTLETSEDLLALFETLNSVKDKNGNPAILTANTIVANPNFKKIKEDHFLKYHYIPFSADLHHDPMRADLLTLVRQGMQQRLYYPQLHGREHLNIRQWLKALQNGHRELKDAFELQMFGVPLQEKVNMRNNVMAALDLEQSGELIEQGEIIQDAQRIFQQLFGFTSTSFIAPSYVWHPQIESAFAQAGIKLIQGLPYQYIPHPGGTWYKTKFRYTGKKSNNGIVHLSRNAFFEPSLQPRNTNIVGECLSRIKLSFQMRKPAIIGSHRLNFIGSLDERNRVNNLKLFSQLLKQIVKKWPTVEFASTDSLFKTFKQ